MTEELAFPELLDVSQRYREAVHQILSYVANGTYCALMGPRFSGKSQLLHSVRVALSDDPSRVCLYLDLRELNSSTQTGFFQSLLETSAQLLRELTGCSVPMSHDTGISSADFRSFLTECVKRLRRDVVMVLDSLEAVPNDLVQALLTSLRAAYMDQQSSEFRLVVVLSGALSLARRTVGESSPLRGIAERVLVRELTEEESLALVQQQLAPSSAKVSPAATMLVLRAAQGDPTLIHWVCQQCLRIVREAPLQTLTVATIKRVMREFVRHEAQRYAPIQEAVRVIEDDPSLLECAIALLEKDVVPMRELPLPLSPDLDPLYLTGMVRAVGGDKYQLRNELYRQCLAEHFDPGRVGHLLTMTGRWDAAIDYLQASVQSGDTGYRPDLLAATINSIYASEDLIHAAHYLTRGLSAAFGIKAAQVWHVTPEGGALRLVGGFGSGSTTAVSDLTQISLAEDQIEARAFRQGDPLRGAEIRGVVERAVPLMVPGANPIGVVTLVEEIADSEPLAQREVDLQMLGYLNQGARAMVEVQTRQRQLVRIATLEQERTAQELRMAREIQVSFLPESCPDLPGWEISADWRAAREVGGDFYDFIPVDDDHIGLVIADVSDKGVPAALFMSLSRTLLRITAPELRSPGEALRRLNSLVMKESRSGMFLTLFYGVLNWRNGTLRYARAGHNPPLLWRASMATSAPDGLDAPPMLDARSVGMNPMARGRDVTLLMAQGAALGVQDEPALEERTVVLDHGDILILYTDGVTEPINGNGEEFGESRLAQVLRGNCRRSCSEIVDRIHNAVTDFVGDQPPFDDYTLLGVKRVG